MARQKTLFKKYLQISMAIVLISFLILGVMLIFFVARFSQEDKRELLTENAYSVSNMISDNSRLVDNMLLINNDTVFETVVSTMSKSINANIFIVDRNGKVQLSSENTSSEEQPSTIQRQLSM